jgi:hypothetical protein
MPHWAFLKNALIFPNKYGTRINHSKYPTIHKKTINMKDIQFILFGLIIGMRFDKSDAENDNIDRTIRKTSPVSPDAPYPLNPE